MNLNTSKGGGTLLFLEKLFNMLLIIGLILLAGRLITLLLLFLDIPFTTIFTDYSLISFIILIIGAIGSHTMKDRRKKRSR